MGRKVNTIRYDMVLEKLRRDIVTGVYPVGTTIQLLPYIRNTYSMGAATAYKIINLLEQDGLIQVKEKSKCLVIPFDQEKWITRLQKEAAERLSDQLAICKQVELHNNTVETLLKTNFHATAVK